MPPFASGCSPPFCSERCVPRFQQWRAKIFVKESKKLNNWNAAIVSFGFALPPVVVVACFAAVSDEIPKIAATKAKLFLRPKDTPLAAAKGHIIAVPSGLVVVTSTTCLHRESSQALLPSHFLSLYLGRSNTITNAQIFPPQSLIQSPETPPPQQHSTTSFRMPLHPTTSQPRNQTPSVSSTSHHSLNQTSSPTDRRPTSKFYPSPLPE